ncbi:hypothetical protein B0J11DRAFT_174535 [Dendryphion nanum]|uniref:Uncharacterized protein n=1 Tax=Dendryphion nanum TaxID=256645 RepID=A0A9P9IZB0_9PLEO|nr:hypothetical protein B0J11DRAFT_174535 [Dendryphion nanum]
MRAGGAGLLVHIFGIFCFLARDERQMERVRAVDREIEGCTVRLPHETKHPLKKGPDADEEEDDDVYAGAVSDVSLSAHLRWNDSCPTLFLMAFPVPFLSWRLLSSPAPSSSLLTMAIINHYDQHHHPRLAHRNSHTGWRESLLSAAVRARVAGSLVRMRPHNKGHPRPGRLIAACAWLAKHHQ